MGRARRFLAHAAKNAFLDQPPAHPFGGSLSQGPTYGDRPDRVRLSLVSDRNIISSIYMRMALDFASVDIRHVRLDEQKRYIEDINSGIHDCFNVEANIDQGARHFMKDVAMTLFSHGVAAIIPIDYRSSPFANAGGSWDIQTMRVGTVTAWQPRHVMVKAYNDMSGRHEEIRLHKREVAIVENPFYEVMNEPNSILQRLTRKLNLLDTTDEMVASGKLDMIIQLPYVIRTEKKRSEAEVRRKDIEHQLRGNKYGIAYTDGTEKITQLNRPVENNLLPHVKLLFEQLHEQIGLTPEILNGSAEEGTMLNYYNRAIEPLLGAVAEALARTFLTKTARSQGQAFGYFRDPFKLVPMKDLAELADKLARNEIVTSNEFRGFIGMRPSKDPKADELRNSNLTREQTGYADGSVAPPSEGDGASVVATAFDEVDKELDKVFADLEVSV